MVLSKKADSEDTMACRAKAHASGILFWAKDRRAYIIS